MSNHRLRPPRFSLRALMLGVLVVAVALAGFDGWRRIKNARAARAEWERLIDYWHMGVIPNDEVIEAAQNVLETDDSDNRRGRSTSKKRILALLLLANRLERPECYQPANNTATSTRAFTLNPPLPPSDPAL